MTVLSMSKATGHLDSCGIENACDNCGAGLCSLACPNYSWMECSPHYQAKCLLTRWKGDQPYEPTKYEPILETIPVWTGKRGKKGRRTVVSTPTEYVQPVTNNDRATRDAKIIQMRKDGAGYVEIAAETQTSRGSVYTVLKKAGLV